MGRRSFSFRLSVWLAGSLQDFARAGADMFTFHLEALLPCLREPQAAAAGDAATQVEWFGIPPDDGSHATTFTCSWSRTHGETADSCLSVTYSTGVHETYLRGHAHANIRAHLLRMGLLVRDAKVSALAARVRATGMHVGLALCPSTPAEAVVPYVEANEVDMVRLSIFNLRCRTDTTDSSSSPLCVPLSSCLASDSQSRISRVLPSIQALLVRVLQLSEGPSLSKACSQ
jgi:hypothetical protein